MGETARRLLAFLRIVERGPAPFGELGDDAVLDAWFGRQAPARTPDPAVLPETSAPS
ncbi:hypothetical protein [Kribbella sp. NPDC023855]|uniref:hypothetical protein n=1 Tax=Kribbella sp. NPDC023855 TaxID=3154698 RepID=UPI0033EFC905